MSKENYTMVFTTKIQYKNAKVYKPAIPQIVKAIFGEELNEARKRLKTSGGYYKYRPSVAYIKFLQKLCTNIKHEQPKTAPLINE